jgi:hypothetical protein
MSIPPFTHIRDVDMLILQKLDDEHLFDICTLNAYANSLCRSAKFWRNRFMLRFAPDLLSGKPSEMSWREYYVELSNSDELEGLNRLYYISLSAKIFFNEVELKFKGEIINDNLIEKAGISSKANLLTLFELYSSNREEEEGGFLFQIYNDDRFKNIFHIELERLERLGSKEIFGKSIEKLIPYLLVKPLRTDTLLYSKMYDLYNKEKVILDKFRETRK